MREVHNWKIRGCVLWDFRVGMEARILLVPSGIRHLFLWIFCVIVRLCSPFSFMAVIQVSQRLDRNWVMIFWSMLIYLVVIVCAKFGNESWSFCRDFIDFSLARLPVRAVSVFFWCLSEEGLCGNQPAAGVLQRSVHQVPVQLQFIQGSLVLQSARPCCVWLSSVTKRRRLPSLYLSSCFIASSGVQFHHLSLSLWLVTTNGPAGGQLRWEHSPGI